MASNYGFIITKDHTEDAECLIAPVIGPSDISDSMIRSLVNEAGQEFRMWDDDGGLCYEGRWLGTNGSQTMFGPLDDFGDASGCTSISYKNSRGTFDQL